MLVWAIIFLVIAIVSGLFGFRKIEGTAAQIAKVLFFLFMVMFGVSLVMSLMNRVAS